jgi:type VI secretion system protein ImpK
VIGGERFFEILPQMQQDPGRHGDVVELMYLCLSLGFEGRYRVMPRGVAALTELRDGVYRGIRQRRGEFERELSPQWRGIAAAARPLAWRVPIWAIGLGTLAIAAAMYISFSFLLAGQSDVAFAELHALPPQSVVLPRHVPVAPAPVTSAPAPAAAPVAEAPSSLVRRLRTFLAPEIKAGLVQVLQDAQAVTVRLTNRNMFGSGEATLSAASMPLLGRIGDALKDEPGKILVNGYTDNQPIRTARFPSNFELSQARANAVAGVLRGRIGEPSRLTAQGKGDASPLAGNDTPEGRQQNRRTEIVLVREADRI